MKNVSEKRIEELLAQLTLDEKIGMIHGSALFHTAGVERFGIPQVNLSDGPMGVRCEFAEDAWIPIGENDDFVTYLPCNSAIAATWNRSLAGKCGQVLGAEARGRGKDVILGPGVNIKRSPLCGRNFEYMSEDPYLTAETAVALIKGIQENDVAACVKHFAMNNQETNRLMVEVEADERTLREIYLPAFYEAVTKGECYSLMGAYVRYQKEHCCESSYLLNEILRKEWGYDGMVVSDWGAVHHTEEAARSGLDIEMSVTSNFNEYFMADPLKKAIEDGTVLESDVDEKVRHILRMMLRLNMLDGTERKAGTYNTPEHREVVLETARESVILLKNEENVLPYAEKETKELLVIGDNAARIHCNGGGSAEIRALYEITPLMGIKKLLGGNAKVRFVQGYYADECGRASDDSGWQSESLENGGGTQAERENASEALLRKQKALREEAAALAAQYEKVILIGGLNHAQDSEGVDRSDIRLPFAQDELIEAVLEANPNTVIVMHAGAPVAMSWREKAKALVWNWYGGMEGGTALAEVLFGRVNPSGKLPETLVCTHEDCPAHCIGEYPGEDTVNYREGVFVGYRHYETANIPVQFPFGFGLSYTEFAYQNLSVTVEEENRICAEVTVKNVGAKEGKEVVQLYTGDAPGEQRKVPRPKKELRAFEKITLLPGEEKTVRFWLNEKDFAFYDVEKKAFTAEHGTYRIYVGTSCADTALIVDIVL